MWRERVSDLHRCSVKEEIRRRTESLLVVDRARLDIRKNGGFVEVPWKVYLLASNDDPGPVLDCVLDMRVNLVDGSLVDQGSVGDTLSSSLSNLEVPDSFCELLREGIVDSVLYVDSVCANAGANEDKPVSETEAVERCENKNSPSLSRLSGEREEITSAQRPDE